jgi:hypothetical protein
VGTDWLSLAEFEVSDRLTGLGNDRLLAGDYGEVANRSFNQLRILCSFADSHIYDNLGESWDLHPILVTELGL